MNQEVELKLELSPEAAEVFVKSALVPAQSSKARLRATYFDTPDRQLRAHGYTLRIRRSGKERVQTVKATGGDGGAGLFARAEWEMPVDDDVPVIDTRTPVAALLRGDASAIEPVFHVNVERRTWDLLQDGATVELVLDRGSIVAGERQAPVCEIELELAAGEPAALFAVARKIGETAPVRPGVAAKSERGYRLLEAAPPSFKAEPVALKPGARTHEAFQAVGHACLRHYRLNEAILLDQYDPRALHQARVAVRRMRSLLSIFKPVLDQGDAGRFKEDLRWLAGLLGEARDLDVLSVSGADERLEEARLKVQAKVREALMSDRVRTLLIDLLEWLTLGTAVAIRDEPAEDFAARRIEHLYRQVAKGGRGMEKLSDEARHEVRKSAKKLRYASEFFAALFAQGKKGRRRHEKFIDALQGLQDDLGALNDLVSMPEILAAHDLPHQPERGVKKRKKKLVGAAAAAHEDLVDARRFWR